MSRQAPCPACGAPVEFKVSASLVTVCPFCNSAIARGDKKLEDHGKVADIAETQSPLKLDLKGKFRGKPFRLVGRVQYNHSAGGVWDEWYAQFPNGKWGWLSEAQGRFYMTFRPKDKDTSWIPPMDSIQAGGVVQLKDNEFTVAEIGQGTIAGAEGDIPYSFTPGEEHTFADLYGKEGQFASLDYGGEPAAFFGWQVSLAEIGLAGVAAAPKDAKAISARQVACPNCAGALTLQAPDETMRVGCPYCNSLLDCDKGNLEFLKTLKKKVNPLIELGSRGTLYGTEFTVIGFMQRSVRYDIRYYWTEYLLYNPGRGFCWLINANDHWSFVETVSPADVHDYKSSAAYDGKNFKLFERTIARVETVLGEFYWKVESGEEVAMRDLIAPPYSLSIERSMEVAAQEEGAGRAKMNLGEVNISVGTYTPHADVEEAFKVSDLPRSFKVAPNQPFPCERTVYGYWLAVICALFVVYGAATMIKDKADGWLLIYAMFFASIIPVGALAVNYFFDVKRWSDSDFSPYATDD